MNHHSTTSQIIAEGRMHAMRASDFPLVFDTPLVAWCGYRDGQHLGYLVMVPDTPQNRELYPASKMEIEQAE
jgi:hypothetical protein